MSILSDSESSVSSNTISYTNTISGALLNVSIAVVFRASAQVVIFVG